MTSPGSVAKVPTGRVILVAFLMTILPLGGCSSSSTIPKQALGPSTPVAIMGGIENGKARLIPMGHNDGSPEDQLQVGQLKGAEYYVVASDGARKEIGRVAVTMQNAGAPSDPPDYFQAFTTVVALPTRTEHLILFHNKESIATFYSKPAEPEIELLFPRGGEKLPPGDIDVRWKSSDPDGDPLRHTLESSTNGGATWSVIVSTWPGDHFNFNAAYLPNTRQGMIRVTATDGIRAASSTNSAFFEISGSTSDARSK